MTDTTREILTIVLREMRAYGRGWRADWSDFDGRQLRSQLSSLATWAEEAVASGRSNDYTEGTEFERYRNEALGWLSR